jgi:translation initiation factor IF-3
VRTGRGSLGALAKIRIDGELHGTPVVHVIGAAGEDLGAMPLAQALRLAMKDGLDLVEVNPKAEPPVCKLIDFGKYKYEERKTALARKDKDPDDEPA